MRKYGPAAVCLNAALGSRSVVLFISVNVKRWYFVIFSSAPSTIGKLMPVKFALCIPLCAIYKRRAIFNKLSSEQANKEIKIAVICQGAGGLAWSLNNILSKLMTSLKMSTQKITSRLDLSPLRPSISNKISCEEGCKSNRYLYLLSWIEFKCKALTEGIPLMSRAL